MIGLLIDLIFARRDGRRKKALANVIARVKHKGFVDSARDAALKQLPPGVAPAQIEALLPLTRPLAGDLVTAYALDGENDWSYLGQPYLDEHKLTHDMLHDAAVGNVGRQFVATARAGKVICGDTGNTHAFHSEGPFVVSSVLLLTSLWRKYEQDHGCELLVVAPGRDFVAYVPLPASGEARRKQLVRGEILKAAAIEAFEHSRQHALSEFAFRVRDGKFTVAEQLGDRTPEVAALLDTPAGRALFDQCAAVRQRAGSTQPA